MYIPLSLCHPYPRGNTQPSMPATQGGAEVCLQHSSIPPDNAATRGGLGGGGRVKRSPGTGAVAATDLHHHPSGAPRHDSLGCHEE